MKKNNSNSFKEFLINDKNIIFYQVWVNFYHFIKITANPKFL